MKLYLKSHLKNVLNNEIVYFESNAIKDKNKIKYKNNDDLYTWVLKPQKLILNRNNKDIECTMYYELNKTIPSIYTIKENNISVDINIKTEKIKIEENKIYIKYIVEDSNDVFEYTIETSEINEFKK